MNKDSCIYVAGHGGLVGSAMVRECRSRGVEVVTRSSAHLDLRDRAATHAFLKAVRPDIVVLAAAKVGGILANSSYPAEFLSDNLRIQVNVLDAALAAGVERLLFLGSSCIYPKHAQQPIREDALLGGPLEKTNDAYAIAKIAGITQVDAMRRQYGVRWISVMPTNLYGPRDNFELTNSHVLPAMIRKFDDAVRCGGPVTMWGTGTPRREFLHVDDLAAACMFLLEQYDDSQVINVGTGKDISISSLATLVADIVGYQGPVTWDADKPDGTARKLLDISKISALGWRPTIGLVDGIRATYEWYKANRASART